MVKEEIIRRYIEKRPKEDVTRYDYISDYYNNSGDTNLTETNKLYLVKMLFNFKYFKYNFSIINGNLPDEKMIKKIGLLENKIFPLIKHSPVLIKEFTKIGLEEQK